MYVEFDKGIEQAFELIARNYAGPLPIDGTVAHLNIQLGLSNLIVLVLFLL